MTRHVSGVFRRTDRVKVDPGRTVRLVGAERGRECNANLVEIGMSDLLLSCAQAPRLGSRVTVGITLPGRYLEFELLGMVSWQLDGQFGVSFDYLSARQTYALVLAIDLMRSAADAANSARKLTGVERG